MITKGNIVEIQDPDGMRWRPAQVKRVNADGSVDCYCPTSRDVHVRTTNYREIELTPELMEKIGFQKDGFTNLSPDFYLKLENGVVSVNLRKTCDKYTCISVFNYSTKLSLNLQSESLQTEKLYLNQLQNVIEICGLEYPIENHE